VQKKLEEESATDLNNNSVEMQTAWQELHRNHLQLAQKTTEIEYFTQVGWHPTLHLDPGN
jgi:hypothetical protein